MTTLTKDTSRELDRSSRQLDRLPGAVQHGRLRDHPVRLDGLQDLTGLLGVGPVEADDHR